MLELIVRIIHINLPVNHPILKRCRPLYEYSWFIQQIKTHQLAGMSRDDAIVTTMADCRTDGLAEGRLEGLAEGKLEGLAEGKAISILELLEDLGQVPEGLKAAILIHVSSHRICLRIFSASTCRPSTII